MKFGRPQANFVSTKMDDLSRAVQAWENLQQRHQERAGDQLPNDMRLATLFSMCPTDLETELTAQQHLFPDSAQMRSNIMTVIYNHSPWSRSNDDEDFERRGQQSRCQ